MTVPLPSSGSGSWYSWAQQLHDRVLIARTALFGSSANDETPVCEYELTTGYTGLAPADYLITGNMTPIVDNFGMMNTAAPFYRCTVPYAGRWDVEWEWIASVSGSPALAAKVHKNVPVSGVTPAQAAVGYSIITGSQSPGAEQFTRANKSVILAAGDVLSFGVWASLTFNMPTSVFGGVKTRLSVRYKGPK